MSGMECNRFNGTNRQVVCDLPEGPCKCCPYGFHIDTDFVRYCDALLSALYANKKRINTSAYRAYGSFRRKYDLNKHTLSYDSYARDLSSSAHAFYGFPSGDHSPTSHLLDSLLNDTLSLKEQVNTTRMVGLCENRNGPLTNSIETELSTPVFETDSMFSEAIHKLDEVFVDCKENLYTPSTASMVNMSFKSEAVSPPLSPTPSSCNSLISKSVLTQIRNHLAMSLSRVKDLENQVAQIPLLKAQIERLTLERGQLLQEKEKRLTSSFGKDACLQTGVSSVEIGVSASICSCTAPLSQIQHEPTLIEPVSKHSVGTLTSLAPRLMSRNAFVQTQLKMSDISTKSDMCSVAVSTETVSLTMLDNGSQTETTACAEKSTTTSDVLHHCSYEARPSWLEYVGDKSVTTASPSSSTHSIRLCDKCSEMITSTNSDYICSHDMSIMLPKIIKSDSGISVERRQVDNKIIEESDNVILVYPAPDIESIRLSDDSDYSKSPPKENQQNTNIFRYNSEIKAALKIINDNLSESKTSFLFAKSVDIVKKNWFKISSSVDSDSRIVENYLDCLEKFSTKLLNFIVNFCDTNGNTAMHYAISYNNFDIVSVLLDSKVCDVNQFNKAGYTAVMLVSLAKIENEIYRDVVERLFNQADVNLKAKQNGQTALMLAASHGRVEISKILLECGAEVNLQDNDGSTALMCAAEHGHSEVISLLLSHPDCDPTLEDNDGSNALKIALVNGHNDIGVLLYAGIRNTSFFSCSLNSSLNRIPPGGAAAHLPRSGSFTYSPSPSPAAYNSFRNSPQRSSSSTPSSPFKS